MSKATNDKWLFCIIYFVTLAITLHYAIFRQVIISDQELEYSLYLASIKNGGWHFITDNIVNSCLTVTLLPAYIQRWTGLNLDLVFKAFPCFFYSLMPAFVYLIARKYLSKSYSILTAALVLSNVYFLFTPAIGRVGVGLGFMSGLMWGIATKRYWYATTFGILLVFSHYGTTFIALGLVAYLWLFYIVRRVFNMDFRKITIVLAAFLTFTIMWHFVIAAESGRYAERFTSSAITSATTAILSENETKGLRYRLGTDRDYNLGSFYSLDSREKVIQEAFGKSLPSMNTPQKIELVLSWLIVIILSLGLIYCLWRRVLAPELLLMAVLTYCLILLALLIPAISVYYGIVRVYFTSLILLAPMPALAIRAASNKLKFHGEWIMVAIILPYALCVSGLMHSFFGIVK